MRLTASQLRNAVIDPSYRLPTGRSSGGPSTDGSLRRAIRMVHAGGADAARAALGDSLGGKYWRAGRGLTMANTARAALDTYIQLAAMDPREAFAGKTVTYLLGGDQIAVNVDVVLFEDQGYSGRICIAGPLARPLTKSERTLLAAPALLALAEELEDELETTVNSLEVWELRSGLQGTVARGEADAAVSSVRGLLDRLR